MKLRYSNSGLSKTLLVVAFALTTTISGCFSADTQANENNAQKSSTAKSAQSVEKTSTTNAEQAEKDDIVEGKHYVEIFPEMQTDTQPGKVEVVELFWLGCPHCYHLEPFIKNYKKSKPGYVDFQQVPAILNPEWKSHAKAFYTAQAVDPENKLQLIDKMFYAIHEQGRRLSTASAQKRFFGQHGVSEQAFDNAYNSMLMQTKMSRANTVSRTSQATGVPAIIIDGKYRTSAYMAGSEQKLLKIINKLTKDIKNGK